MTRRPIKTRGAAWVQKLAADLAAAGVTPNQISIGSVLFAALAWLALSATSQNGSGPAAIDALWFGAAAICIQLRLLCNLLDGIVAVEGGKGDADGPFWNEAPDRLADLLILAGLGIASGHALLGMTASALAIATAYLRELGRAEGMEPDFSGPCAKPQRMALATVTVILAGICAIAVPDQARAVLLLGLWIITIGTGATIARRCYRLIRWMKAKDRA